MATLWLGGVFFSAYSTRSRMQLHHRCGNLSVPCQNHLNSCFQFINNQEMVSSWVFSQSQTIINCWGDPAYFLAGILNSDKIWLQLHEMEMKAKSMQPLLKKFWKVPFVDKRMATTFWGMESIALIDWLEPGTTIKPSGDCFMPFRRSGQGNRRKIRSTSVSMPTPHTRRKTTNAIGTVAFQGPPA